MNTAIKIFAALAYLQVALAFPWPWHNPACHPHDNQDDCAALVELYHATGGNTTWKYNGRDRGSGWLTGKSICGNNQPDENWYRVKCSQKGDFKCETDGRGCRVSEINLSGNNLTGDLGKWTLVGKLGVLTELNLGYNQLTGGPAASLGSSGSLTQLILHNNTLTSWPEKGSGRDGIICPFLGTPDSHPKQWIGYCQMENNDFACPIPECLKKYCKATCKSNEAEAPTPVAVETPVRPCHAILQGFDGPLCSQEYRSDSCESIGYKPFSCTASGWPVCCKGNSGGDSNNPYWYKAGQKCSELHPDGAAPFAPC